MTSHSQSHRNVGTADSVSHNTACIFKGSSGYEKLHCSAFGTNLELLDREAKGRHMVQSLLVLCVRHTESSFVSRMQAMDHAAGQHPASCESQSAAKLRPSKTNFEFTCTTPAAHSSDYGLLSKAFVAKVGGAPLASA